MAKFQIEEKVNAFCAKVPFNVFLRIKIPTPQYPKHILDLFPVFLIYYREKPGKQRMQRTGWNTKKLPTGKWKITAKLVKHKKSKTSNQNNFSVYVHYAKTIGYLGTIKRIAKHKGHGRLVAVYQPTDKEFQTYEQDTRHAHKKYLNFNQLYLARKVYTPEFKLLTERLEADYICHATGQTKLF